jgi:4-hydroxy-tetrahydrodipicolinate synthase
VLAAKKANEETGRNVPVIAGAGGNNTAECCEVGKRLQQAGADALMYVTPYYNKTSQKGLIKHYEAISDAVDLPIIVYNVPSRTSMNLLPETMQEISKFPNIAALKATCGDISQISEFFERCGEYIDIYSGNDDQVLPILSLGGKGVISTLANIAPETMHDLVMKFMEGDIEGSRKLQIDILPMVRALFADVNPMPIKAAMRVLGFKVGGCRLPLVSVEPELVERLTFEIGELASR